MTTTEKRGIQAEDLYELKSVKDPQLSPDGNSFLFVQTSIDKEDSEYRSHLFVSDVEGENIRQWTFGKVRDTSPRWSPDGDTIAFVSNRSDRSQIYLIDAMGGESKQLTACVNGARNPVWSPDGKGILFTTSLGPDDKITDKEKKKKDKEDKEDKKTEPLVVDRIRYKSDEVGFLDDKHEQLAMIDVESGEIEQLTGGEHDYTVGCWSPDGNYITFTADLTNESDYQLVSDAYIMELETKEIQKITNSNGFFSTITWSPNGDYLAFVGHEKEFKSATLSKIWLFNLVKNELSCLTNEWDVQVGDVAIGDFHSGNVNPGIIWTEDSKGIYFLMSDQGNTGVYYGSVEGEMYPVLFENQHVYGLSVNRHNHKAVVAISTPTNPGDMYSIDFSNGTIQRLTNVNEAFLKEIELSEAEPIIYKAHDGWEINGWVMKPIGFDARKKYPLIVEIHGGPHAMYANTYFHEFQMLAAKGFAVLFTNPRGSHGYGQTFVDAVRGDYGGSDYLDVMSAVDYALEAFDFIDETNLGVTGGSYGGFMTNWIVGHTNRFKAAVTQRSISNWLSFYGVSDIGYYFSEWEVNGDLITETDKLWEHSPLRYVSKVETPLLIIHGERDFRCPVEQAEQFYVALKRQKKTTKLVRFPGANHELSRSGNPKQRIQRLNYIKDWFEQYLS